MAARTLRALAACTATLAAAGLGAYLGVRSAERREVAEAREVAPPQVESYTRVPIAAEQSPAPLAAEAEGQTGERARWSELNTMGIRALDAGEIDRAVGLFEQCVRGVPDEPVFRANLAESLARRALRRREREWPCAQCMADLERAVGLAPERADLAKLWERWRKEAELERDFWRESSQHFDLAYDGDRSEILHGSHRILEELENAYGDLALWFDDPPAEGAEERIPVVLYRREGFDALTGLGEWAGGAFDGTVRIPIGDLAREERALAAVLRHELTHAFVLKSGGRKVPGWLNEGIAQWFEPERERSLERARATLEGQELFTLEQLSGSLANFKDSAEVARAYAQSLLAVDRLATQYGERIPLQLVAACKDAHPPAETFQKLTRVPLAEALNELIRQP
jgi:Peptidase MA superfamily